MNPYVIHQMAQERQAELLREAKEYRRAGLTARPTVLWRVTARIPRITARTARAPAGPAGDDGRSVGLIESGQARQPVWRMSAT